MLSTIKVGAEETKNSFGDATMTDQEDEHSFVLDLDLLYGNDPDTLIPNIDKQHRECIKQILVDVVDLSLNEYSMHYISHSENEYMAPFNDLKSKVKNELFKFYKSSCESIPFKQWSEMIDEHSKILGGFMPVTIMKELHEYRFSFMTKYTKNRIKSQLKKFSQNKANENRKSGFKVFSSNEQQDPTVLTEEEYLEMSVAEYIDTPFFKFLVSCLKSKSSKTMIISLLAHIKEKEEDIIKIYNHNYEVNKKFTVDTEFKDRTIEKYKTPRGFPLKLKPTEARLYSMEESISVSELEKIKFEKEKEKEMRLKQQMARDDTRTNSFSLDTDSCEDEPPFMLSVERARMSHPEKRTSKFEPLANLNVLKSWHQNDAHMSDDEESKSEVSQEERVPRPSLGGISAFIKNHAENYQENADEGPFTQSRSSLQGLILEKTGNTSGKPSLPTSSMIRFSDLEKMEDDVDMEETPERLTFSRT